MRLTLGLWAVPEVLGRVDENVMALHLYLQPTALKLIVPMIIIPCAFMNLQDLGFGFYQCLWLPFSYFMRIQPFVYTDKPWFATMWGEGLAATFWSLLYYVALSIRIRRG